MSFQYFSAQSLEQATAFPFVFIVLGVGLLVFNWVVLANSAGLIGVLDDQSLASYGFFEDPFLG